MKTYQRIRSEGTVETIAGNNIDRIQAIQQIVDQKQYAKIDGNMIDLWTAQTILQVYNALKPENQLKYANLRAGKMAVVAYNIIK